MLAHICRKSPAYPWQKLVLCMSYGASRFIHDGKTHSPVGTPYGKIISCLIPSTIVLLMLIERRGGQAVNTPTHF